MSKLQQKQTRHPAAPVHTRQLPVVNCATCDHPLPHEPGPGNAEAVLTEHYNRQHLTELAAPPR